MSIAMALIVVVPLLLAAWGAYCLTEELRRAPLQALRRIGWPLLTRAVPFLLLLGVLAVMQDRKPHVLWQWTPHATKVRPLVGGGSTIVADYAAPTARTDGTWQAMQTYSTETLCRRAIDLRPASHPRRGHPEDRMAVHRVGAICLPEGAQPPALGKVD